MTFTVSVPGGETSPTPSRVFTVRPVDLGEEIGHALGHQVHHLELHRFPLGGRDGGAHRLLGPLRVAPAPVAMVRAKAAASFSTFLVISWSMPCATAHSATRMRGSDLLVAGGHRGHVAPPS